MTNHQNRIAEKSFDLDMILIHINRWEIMANTLRTIHIALGLLAIIFSILVASKINSFSKDYIEWFSFGAAVSVGLQTGFDLGEKANRMRQAWRKAYKSYMLFLANEEHTETMLINDFYEAEEIVGDVKTIVR